MVDWRISTSRTRELEFVEGDLTNRSDVERAVDGVEVIFHEAALASVPRSVAKPLDTNAACVTGTVNLLDAARRAGVRRVVYAGSSSAYGDRTAAAAKHETDLPAPVSPYAAAKLAGELYCQAFQATVWLGNRRRSLLQRVRSAARSAKRIRSGDSKVRDDHVGRPATDDLRRRQAVARFHLRRQHRAGQFAGSRSGRIAAGQTFNIACGEKLDLLDLIAAINRVLGTKIEPIFDPPRVGDVRDSLADISRARKVLGYEPEIDFDEGLRRSIEYYRQLAAKK